MTDSDGIADVAQASLTEADVPGAAVALVVDGHPISTGIGFRDLDRRLPIDSEDRFYLYSITKVLLAVAVLRLVEEGLAVLDQPIQIVLPELPLDAPITLRQLLNHTAGLPDYGAEQEYTNDLSADPGTPWKVDEFLAWMLRRGLRFPPGQGWAYSNLGFLLVRCVIERLSRRSLRDAMARLVFAPVGLRQTMVAESLDDAHDLTPGYSTTLDRDGVLCDVTRHYHPGWVSHGVVISTAAETARLLEVLFTGQLLTPGSLAAMVEAVEVPGEHPPFVCPAYGLGLMIDDGSSYGRVAGHAGGGPGYSTAAFHFPAVAKHRVTVVALANRDQLNLGVELAFALADFAGRRQGHG